MARPVQADADATKRRILDVARGLFSAKGHGETSMRDIAGGAQVSLATVHHYFGNKAALYKASVDSMYEDLTQLKAELLPIVEASEDPRRSIDQVIRRSYAFCREHQPAIRLTMRTVVDTGELSFQEGAAFLADLADGGSLLISSVSPIPAPAARMHLLTMNFLVVRYALCKREELIRLMGVNDDDVDAAYEKAVKMVEDYLADLADLLIFRSNSAAVTG